MIIGDNRDYIRVLLYSYYTTITGWRGPLRYGALWLSRKLKGETCAGSFVCWTSGKGLRVYGLKGQGNGALL